MGFLGNIFGSNNKNTKVKKEETVTPVKDYAEEFKVASENATELLDMDKILENWRNNNANYANDANYWGAVFIILGQAKMHGLDSQIKLYDFNNYKTYALKASSLKPQNESLHAWFLSNVKLTMDMLELTGQITL